jgi:hypothetical protein
MSFGRYRGKPLDQVPTNYLRWVLDNAHSASPALRRQIKAILEPAPSPGQYSVSTADDFRQIIKSLYLHASKRYHPDHGGTHDKQVIANECYESLMQAVNALDGEVRR